MDCTKYHHNCIQDSKAHPHKSPLHVLCVVCVCVCVCVSVGLCLCVPVCVGDVCCCKEQYTKYVVLFGDKKSLFFMSYRVQNITCTNICLHLLLVWGEGERGGGEGEGEREGREREGRGEGEGERGEGERGEGERGKGERGEGRRGGGEGEGRGEKGRDSHQCVQPISLCLETTQ